MGRLYDLDVLSPEGEKLSRPQSRRCLICGGPVTVCSRSRAHGLPAIRARTRDILADFAAGHLSALARQALEDEVDLTPKPGLVDRRNTGAHDDMDRPCFTAGRYCMHYGEIKNCDIANGEGVRVTLFVSGCTNTVSTAFSPRRGTLTMVSPSHQKQSSSF